VCGGTDVLHCGQVCRWRGSLASCARRLPVREFECRRFGTAMIGLHFRVGQPMARPHPLPWVLLAKMKEIEHVKPWGGSCQRDAHCFAAFHVSPLPLERAGRDCSRSRQPKRRAPITSPKRKREQLAANPSLALRANLAGVLCRRTPSPWLQRPAVAILGVNEGISPMIPAWIHSLVSRAPSEACPWLPIWLITPAVRAALATVRHSRSVWVRGFWQ
jgi:hypothetical protein